MLSVRPHVCSAKTPALLEEFQCFFNDSGISFKCRIVSIVNDGRVLQDSLGLLYMLYKGLEKPEQLK